MIFAHMHHIFTWFWLGWLGLFIVFEAAALLLANKFKKEDEAPYTGGTLSEFVWRLIKRNAWIFAVFTVFWGWLTAHFLFGI